MAKSKKKKIFIALAIVVGIGIISLGVVKAASGKQDNQGQYVSVIDVEKAEDFEATIVSDGILMSKDQRNIVSNLPYTVSEVLAKEGTKVSQGDILARLDTKELEYKIKTAEINLELEKERLKDMEKKAAAGTDTFQLEKSLENAKLTYEEAKKKYEGSVLLYDSGAISKAQLDGDEIALVSAKNNLELLEKQLKDALENDDSKNSIEIQRKNVQLQEINLESQREALEESIIRSPMKGTIVLSNAKVGVPASSTNPLFIIDDTDNLEIEVSISEYDINSIKLGQKVKITGEAFKGQEFDGAVSFVAPTATVMNTSTGRETNVKVKIDIANTGDSLKPGLSADVTINTDHKNEAMVVPYEVLYQKKDGTTVVFKVENNKAVEVPVQTGIQGDLKVEIISDEIDFEDKIILNPTEKIVDDMDVTIMNTGDVNDKN